MTTNAAAIIRHRIWQEYRRAKKMAKLITYEIKNIIRSKDTVKVVSAVGKDGNPHTVFKGSLDVNEDGNLYFLEVMDTSQISKNLTYSIWFHKKVSVNILSADGRSYQIKEYIHKDIIAGSYFEEQYKKLRQRNEKADLTGIWVIEPDEIREETFSLRLQYEIDN
jgi:hypothetical protein